MCSRSSEHRPRQALPPHFLFAAVLLGWAFDRWLPILRLWNGWGAYLGGAVILASLAVNIYCAMQFRKHQTTIIPFRESSQLLTTGLYSRSRNPIYVSMVVLLCGFAIFWGSLSPWLVPPAFAILISNRFIRAEEAMLRAKFGDEYDKYCQRVRRWF